MQLASALQCLLEPFAPHAHALVPPHSCSCRFSHPALRHEVLLPLLVPRVDGHSLPFQGRRQVVVVHVDRASGVFEEAFLRVAVRLEKLRQLQRAARPALRRLLLLLVQLAHKQRLLGDVVAHIRWHVWDGRVEEELQQDERAHDDEHADIPRGGDAVYALAAQVAEVIVVQRGGRVAHAELSEVEGSGGVGEEVVDAREPLDCAQLLEAHLEVLGAVRLPRGVVAVPPGVRRLQTDIRRVAAALRRCPRHEEVVADAQIGEAHEEGVDGDRHPREQLDHAVPRADVLRAHVPRPPHRPADLLRVGAHFDRVVARVDERRQRVGAGEETHVPQLHHLVVVLAECACERRLGHLAAHLQVELPLLLERFLLLPRAHLCGGAARAAHFHRRARRLALLPRELLPLPDPSLQDEALEAAGQHRKEGLQRDAHRGLDDGIGEHLQLQLVHAIAAHSDGEARAVG
mmetsp:Transcript_7953/g.17545  ORF Transcript_7953/g.17545 Transcript_7953/m.17545 type:complete len:460 (-) Transcript_7953:1001-2380(-)